MRRYFVLVALLGSLVSACGNDIGNREEAILPDSKSNHLSTLTMADSVSITSPVANSTVSGTIVVEASALMANGVSRVEFYKDYWSTSGLFGVDYSAPFQMSLNTSQLLAGSHTLGVRAYDTQGAMVQYAHNVSVLVEPTPIPQVLSFSSPAPGETITGSSYTVSAFASMPSGVNHVDFFIDDLSHLIGTSRYPNYSTLIPRYYVEFNSTLFSNGPHTFFARAVDSSGTYIETSVGASIFNHYVVLTPAANSVVSGQITLSVTAPTFSSVSRVEFYLDTWAGLIGTRYAPPFELPFNTLNFPDGPRTIGVKVYSGSGQLVQYAHQIQVLNNTFTVLAPPSLATVSGDVPIEFQFTGPLPVDEILVWVSSDSDFLPIPPQSTNPYRFVIHTADFANGHHGISILIVRGGINFSSYMDWDFENTPIELPPVDDPIEILLPPTRLRR